MLRRLKAQVTQVANELPELLTNSSREDSMDGEREGFLCPVCMATFSSPEQLSVHFASHDNGATNDMTVDNPNFGLNDSATSNSSLVTDTTVKTRQHSTKDKEIDELRQQVKDEKWFSEELKKELDRIQIAVSCSQDVPKEEIPYLMQQIQMLEAGKSMVTQRLLEIEKESNGLRRSLDNSTQEKKEVMDRLKQLTDKIRQLTEENEEKMTANAVMCEEIKQLKNSMAELEKVVDQLNQTLEQRPSEDDVTVLRKELVNAQHLMDEISQQKDVEIKQHISTIRMLSTEREKQHYMIENLQKQMDESGDTNKKVSVQLSSRINEISESKTLSESLQTEIELLKKDLVGKEKTIEETEIRLSSSLKELSDCRAKVIQLEAVVLSSGRSIDDSHQLNEKNQVKLVQLTEKLEQMIEEKNKYEADLCNFEEKTQKQLESIKSLELSNMELTNELSSMGSLLEKERNLLKDKDDIIGQKEVTMNDLKDELDIVNKSLASKTEELVERDKSVQTFQKEICTLKDNSKVLLEKISTEEGGAKMAIDQLNEEKFKLLQDIQILGNSLKEQKTEWEEKVEVLEKKLRESERARSEVQRKYEIEKEDMIRRIREADDEINRKAELFIEMEKENDDEKRKTAERFAKIKDLLHTKDVSAAEMKKQIEQLSSNVSDRDSVIRERERALEDSRVKVEQCLETIKHAEEKARKLEANLERIEYERSGLSESESELKERLAQLDKNVDEYKEKIGKLNDELKEKSENIQVLQREQNEKDEHWKGRLVTLESQLEENHKANDELIGTVKDMTAQIDVLKKEVELRQLKAENENSRAEDLSHKIVDLETALHSEKDIKGSMEKKVESLVLEIDSLQRQTEFLKNKLEKENEKVETLQSESESKTKEIETEKKEREERVSTLEAILMESQQEVSTLNRSLEDSETKFTKVLEDRDKLIENLNEKETELEEYRIRVVQFEEQMSSEFLKMEQLENEKTERCDEVQRNQRKFDELEKVLNTQIRTLNAELEQIRSENTEKQSLIDKLSARSTLLDDQLVQERDVARMKIEQGIEKLEMLQDKFGEQETENIKAQTKLREENESVSRALESVRHELETKKSKFDEIAKINEELATKNAELAEAVGSWEDERNALIERCLNTESDLDFERERAMENKRRFDDALSAMHELGRANQSLQMDISKQSTRKWLDDNEAINCTACGKVFSLTVRKHHCRVCGMIFCNPCSSHTVKLASHKDPVRVCGPCLQEVNNR